MLNKCVVLFWDSSPAPSQVVDIKEEFRRKWVDYKVVLADDGFAKSFIFQYYGDEVFRIYDNCRIPAMRSDLFRLLYIYINGGIWVDVKFLPRDAPPDELLGRLKAVDLVCCRWFHGRIVNGFFCAKKGNKILSRMISSAVENIKYKKSNNIFLLTGPGLWSDVLRGYEDGVDYSVVEHDFLFKMYLKKQSFKLSGRGGGEHWSERQKAESLYFR